MQAGFTILGAGAAGLAVLPFALSLFLPLILQGIKSQYLFMLGKSTIC